MSDVKASAPWAIRVRDVSKSYRRMGAGFRLRTLKSALLERSLTGGLAEDEAIAALSEVSLQVAPGEAYGVIGGNGSGNGSGNGGESGSGERRSGQKQRRRRRGVAKGSVAAGKRPGRQAAS